MGSIAQFQCKVCGGSFDYEPQVLEGRELFKPTACEVCLSEMDDKARGEAMRLKNEALVNSWNEICPPLFQDTDETRIPNGFRTAIRDWRYNSKGLAFVGHAGLCKTRAAFELLKRMHFAGKWCEAVSSTKFARLCVDQFHNDADRKARAAARIDAIRGCELLFIDDLGKEKVTDRNETELFDILDHRTTYKLPTIWTANSEAAFSEGRSDNRAEPTMRRLAEFSEFPKP